MIYTLDTNVLIDALRRPAEMLLFNDFLKWALPRTALSSVVASELLVGARTDSTRRLVERELLDAFARRGRIVAPSVTARAKTGLVLGHEAARSIGASWQNDLLLAHTACEFGWNVITRDRDFAGIRPLVKGLRVDAPNPRRPSTSRVNSRGDR
jgi:predicted nucleic acid-binding protein